MTDKWQEELSQIKEQIGRHENSDNNYLSQGVHILELCNKAQRLYLQQTPLKRAKLLHYILSNCALDNAPLCPTYRKPFDIIAKGLSRIKWLPLMGSKRSSSNKVATLLIPIFKRRGRAGMIRLGDPFPAKPEPTKPVYRNIIKEALNVKDFLSKNPQKTYTDAGQRFNLTRARISQLMKVVHELPPDFIEKMLTCDNQAILKAFSGKTLLKIAAFETKKERQRALDTASQQIK